VFYPLFSNPFEAKDTPDSFGKPDSQTLSTCFELSTLQISGCRLVGRLAKHRKKQARNQSQQ